MTAIHPDTLARVTLSRVIEPGDPRVLRLVNQVGAQQTLDGLRDHEDFGIRIAQVNPEQELERAERLGIRFVTPIDSEWPESLYDLDTAPSLSERGGVPIGLWVKGDGGPLNEHQSVAIVGSRSATTYGVALAGEIAAGVAQAGHTVVSGGAFGIDNAAHRGALATQGRTIAVFACGVDRAYPAAHRSLFDYIADTGLLVSEAAPGAAPTRIRFLARNRLIAALSRGTVVVEAAVRSGALNAANWAHALDRPVMGVPGPVTSAASAGVHQLIRAGRATLVTDADEVNEILNQKEGARA